MNKKSRFSFEKHRNTGQKLKELREILLHLSTDIANSYPYASKTCQSAKKAVEAVDKLRCELDSQLFRDCPSEASRDGWKGIYYDIKIDEIKRGIAAYEREQRVLLRLIRKSGGLSASKFDELFQNRETRRTGRARACSRESFILGIAANGFNQWVWHLDLLQMMVLAGMVDIIKRTEDHPDEIVYVLPDKELKA